MEKILNKRELKKDEKIFSLWSLVLGCRSSVIGFCFLLFTVHCSLFIFPALAQEDVLEIESDVLIVESDLELEKIVNTMEPSAEAELKFPDALLQPDVDEQEILDEEFLVVEENAIKAEVIREEEILKINKSLRRVIEQSHRLQGEKKKMQRELGTLRGESRVEQSRREALEEQIGLYEERVQQAAQAQRELDKTIKDLQSKIKAREDVLLGRINELQKQLEGQIELKIGRRTLIGDDGEPIVIGEGVEAAQEAGLDVIQLIDDLDSMQQQMKEDEAKVHYNMGNIFFHQGKFDEAVEEYQKTIEIMPSDASAHFNLAYIAGDFLHDYETAIEHYQQYLYLDPSAEDAPLVQEKILEAQLYVRSWADKDVDREVQGNRPHRLYNW